MLWSTKNNIVGTIDDDNNSTTTTTAPETTYRSDAKAPHDD